MALTASQLSSASVSSTTTSSQVGGDLLDGPDVEGVRPALDHDLVVERPEDDLLWAERAGPLRAAGGAISLVDHAVDQRPGHVNGTAST
jgi:hypothetical protein